MKVMSPQVSCEADTVPACRTEPAYNFLSYFKWRSRTRAVAPEKTPGSCVMTATYVEDAKQKQQQQQQLEEEEEEEEEEENQEQQPRFGRQEEFSSMSESECSSMEWEEPRCQSTMGERSLSNGDFYAGSWQGNCPEGTGKYLWSDGCMYEGGWGKGKKTGRGRISWPSGATYEGEVFCGYLHGDGVYTGVDDSTYKGCWKMNLKHGKGVKSYTNGDVYEGYWKNGLQHGFGRYIWLKGNEYVGEWKKGLMTGKGVLKWSNGDKYDGYWLDGLEHGHGIYTWADGSCYIGSWRKGVKDGTGVFYPRGSLRARMKKSQRAQNKVHHFRDRSYSSDNEVLSCSSWVRSFEEAVPNDLSNQDSASYLERRWSLEGGTSISSKELKQDPPVLEREYVQGVLINEIVKQGGPTPFKSTRRRQRRMSQRPGETVIKGHRSYDLMVNLQLGIRYSVGKKVAQSDHILSSVDFGPRAVSIVKFPKSGSQLTPPHQSLDFKWRDYCPNVFRSLRHMFKIDSADYMMSLCGSDALRELSSPGKSGSVFYLSQDDKFMIKTMRKSEVKVLLDMLPSYYHHVQASGNTLITRFFGLHQVEPHGGRKVRFVVMGNVFCTELQIHRRFDLKGSSQGRSTDKVEIDENTTFKDLDLNFSFHLEPSWRSSLLKQIQDDCRFLESQRIMDYSLLLGVHFRAPQYPTVFSPVPTRTPEKPTSNLSEQHGTPLVQLGEDPKALSSATRLQIRLGVNMPARADRSQCEDGQPGDVYDVVLYLGIIDILQQYDITKKVEHAYKSLQFDSQSISAVEPRLYASRFQNLVRRIFPSNEQVSS